jgi:hypothetical protein
LTDFPTDAATCRLSTHTIGDCAACCAAVILSGDPNCLAEAGCAAKAP